jgi:flagellin
MRIGANLSGVDRLIHFALGKASADLQQSSLKLATLKRIQRGADDPAGLSAAEAIRAELTALEAADESLARSAGTVHIFDSVLSQVSDLLADVEASVVAAAGTLSDEERAAHQQQVDAALEAINRTGNIVRSVSNVTGDSLTVVVGASPGDLATVSLPTISTSALGGPAGNLSALASGGSASLTGDLGAASEILAGARQQVARARAELGAFEHSTIESSRAVIGAAQVNLSQAYSDIADTDVALEASRQSRALILSRASLQSVLTSSRRPQDVLRLLQI